MAVIGNSFIDLADIAKRTDPDGNIDIIIEMLNQTNGVMDDAIAVECNDGARHQHTIRTGLPQVAWGALYQGIPQGKSTTKQVVDTTGFVEGMSSVDTRLLDMNKEPDKIRLSEAEPYIEAMSQEMATGVFYHNAATDAKKFTGLAPRFSSLSAPSGQQIIDAGGVGADNTSIWFVTWGDNQTQLLYPEGTQAGLSREDMGKQRVLDGSGNAYYVEEEVFRWHIGVAVRDWRYVCRIANIDVSNMGAGSVDLYSFMRKAYWKLQNRRVAGGKIAIYCNRDVMEALDGLASNAGASDNFVRLTPMEIEGKEVQTYRGFPIRETDALINTEAQVT